MLGTPQTFTAVSDRTKAITYSGTWRAKSVDTSTDTVHTSASAAGARATYWFTGRSVALVMPRSKIRGKVTVYVDGVNVRTVDTYASTSRVRRVMYVKAWSSVGIHKISIRVAGTAGRPLVSLDGIIVGK